MSAAPAPILPEGPAMSDADFEAFSKLIHAQTGIVMTEGKRWMLTSRLGREIRRLQLRDFSSYLQLLQSPGHQAQMQALISSVTTNVTSFFRSPEHFEALAALVEPLRAQLRGGARVRLWSAGCSTGQEPYSIAMTLINAWPEVLQSDVLILATDIDNDVIRTARHGVYSMDDLQGANPALLRKFTSAGPVPGSVMINPSLRRMIRFEQLNMLGSWPFRGNFDVIFCRNVVIYFDADTRDRLWLRFAERLNPGGWLFLGHSERVVHSLEDLLRPAGITRYQRSELEAGRSEFHRNLHHNFSDAHHDPHRIQS